MENILLNIKEKNHRELARYIREGKCDIETIMLNSSGSLTTEDRKEILRFVSNPDDTPKKREEPAPKNRDENENTIIDGSNDDIAFASARKVDTVEAYMQYLSNFMRGAHRQEARSRIQQLQSPMDDPDTPVFPPVEPKKDSGKIVRDKRKVIDLYKRDIKRIYADKTKTAAQQANNIYTKTLEYLKKPQEPRLETDDLYSIIMADNNLFTALTIKKLLSEKLISEIGLRDNAGIDIDFIYALSDIEPHDEIFSAPSQLDRIKHESTEIYFWGLPSSGKSCIIGGMLRELFNCPDYSINTYYDCNGYDYMQVMRDCFNSPEVISLPPGTPLTACYEMGMEITDTKKRVHPITIIDLAGEVLKAMYLKMTSPGSMTEDDQYALDTADRILSPKLTSKNHKIHFFVVEYNAHELKYADRNHLAYLDGAVNYLRELKVFKNYTDAVYIILSKCDRAPFAKEKGNDSKFKNYFDKEIVSFVKGLENLCKNNHIAKTGKLTFSLGDVCFQNYCKVNSAPSAMVAKKMVELTGIADTGFFVRLLR